MERRNPSISRASAAAHRRALRGRVMPMSERVAEKPGTWLAFHRCPACGSANVRRSSIRGREAGAHAFRSPYRCEACRHRFWVVSRKTRIGAAAAAVAALALAAFAAAWTLLPRYVVTTIDRDIEEWSAPPPLDVAGEVLAPKAVAAGLLAPTGNVSAPVAIEPIVRSLPDGR